VAGDLGQDVGCPRGDTDGDGVRISRTGTWDEEFSEDVGDRGVQGRGVAELLAVVRMLSRWCLPRSTSDVARRIKRQRQEAQGREDVDMEDVLDGFQQKARDHARIPMQASTVIASPARLFLTLRITRSRSSHVVTASRPRVSHLLSPRLERMI
jgi:hypothetical protein